MFDYIFFYPKEYGAPSDVAINIFDSLMKSELSEKIAVLAASKKVAFKVKSKYPLVKIISLKDLLFCSHNLTIHIPVTPTFFPNIKLLAYLISLARRHKLIINFHGEPRSEYKIRFKNHNIKEILLSMPTYLLVPSFVKTADIIVLNSFLMEKEFKHLYNSKRINVVANALPNSWFEIDSVKKINFKKQEFSLFYHGRLSPEKGVDILLQALAVFIKNNSSLDKPIKLYIAGDGEQREKLEKISTNLHINDYVIFLGKVPLDELKSYLISVNVAIYPSTYEPFSLAVLESFALVNGPVLYSQNIGINDFVNKMGFRFCTFEPTVDGITAAITHAYSDRYDNYIQYEQKRFANEFSWEKIIAEYIDLYSQHN